MKKYNQSNIHREDVVQYHIIDQLVANQAYRQRGTEKFDRGLAMDKELVLEFVKSTQYHEWKKLEEHYTNAAEAELFKQLDKALKDRGVLDVLRQGIKLVPNIKIALCFFKPASGLNDELLRLYNANILSIIDELEYSAKNDNRIDIALFINGIPLVTLECKNTATHTPQHTQHSAMPKHNTEKTDRLPESRSSRSSVGLWCTLRLIKIMFL